MCNISAVSSAKSISLIRTFHTLVFAGRWARLNSLPPVLECRHTSSEDEPKVEESNRKKNIPNKVGARTQLCFVPL